MKIDSNQYRTDNLMHFEDSSNYALEGYGVPELLQLLNKPQKEQDDLKKDLAGSTTEVPFSLQKDV